MEVIHHKVYNSKRCPLILSLTAFGMSHQDVWLATQIGRRQTKWRYDTMQNVKEKEENPFEGISAEVRDFV